MDQPFDALLELDERAVVRDRNDAAMDARTDRVLPVDLRPGIRQELLEPERNPLAVPIDVENFDVQFLRDLHHFGRVSDPAPRHVGDVEQSVHTAQVHERTEVGDVLDHTGAHLADQQFLDQRLALLLALGLQDHAARNDDVPPTLVELDDLEVVGLPDQVLDVRNPAQSDLRSRQEGIDAHEVDGYAALDLAGQHTLDRHVVLVGFLDLLPDAEEVGLLLGEHDDAIVVFEALEKDLDLTALFELIGVLELIEGNGALTLEAELEDDGLFGDLEDLGLDDLTFTDVLKRVFVLGEKVRKVVSREIELVVAVGVGEELGRDTASQRLLASGSLLRSGRLRHGSRGFGFGYGGFRLIGHEVPGFPSHHRTWPGVPIR